MNLRNFHFTTLLSLIMLTQPLYAASMIPFTTIADAEQHCPTVNNLIFAQLNPKVPNGEGNIASVFNGVRFNSPYPEIHPKNVTSLNTIEDVQFRKGNDIFGFISGNNTVCYYSYPGFNGDPVLLVMQTAK